MEEETDGEDLYFAERASSGRKCDDWRRWRDLIDWKDRTELKRDEILEELDLAALSDTVHHRILQKLDFDSYTAFDETSSLTHAICEGNKSVTFPLVIDKINFFPGFKSFSLHQAVEGRAWIIASTAALPLGENYREFQLNYEALIQNRSVIKTLLLRGGLGAMYLAKLDKLLQVCPIQTLCLEGKLGDHLLKSTELYKLEKFATFQLLIVTDEMLLGMSEKAPKEIKFDNTTLTSSGVATFIKQFLRCKRSARLIEFPKKWDNLEELRKKLQEYKPRDLTQIEAQDTLTKFYEVPTYLRYYRKFQVSDSEKGFLCSTEGREISVIPACMALGAPVFYALCFNEV